MISHQADLTTRNSHKDLLKEITINIIGETSPTLEEATPLDDYNVTKSQILMPEPSVKKLSKYEI